jgi:hypothetical protein
MPDGPDSLAAFIERAPARDLSIAVVNRTRPQPIQEMVEETFGERSIDVDELDVPDAEADQVVVLDGDDVVATSPLAVLEDEILQMSKASASGLDPEGEADTQTCSGRSIYRSIVSLDTSPAVPM